MAHQYRGVQSLADIAPRLCLTCQNGCVPNTPRLRNLAIAPERSPPIEFFASHRKPLWVPHKQSRRPPCRSRSDCHLRGVQRPAPHPIAAHRRSCVHHCSRAGSRAAARTVRKGCPDLCWCEAAQQLSRSAQGREKRKVDCPGGSSVVVGQLGASARHRD